VLAGISFRIEATRASQAPAVGSDAEAQAIQSTPLHRSTTPSNRQRIPRPLQIEWIFMTTEEPHRPLAPELNWASYVDSLNISAVSPRPRKSRFADAPSVTGQGRTSTGPESWADYIDRLYIDRLLQSLDDSQPTPEEPSASTPLDK
jgi:hypothetical protein